MTLIRRTNPLGELLSLRQAMDRLFEDSYVRPRGGGSVEDHALALDVYTTPDSLVVEAALPGVKPEDLDISVLGDTLTISASTKQEQTRTEEGYSHREIRRGSFSRTVTLPAGLKADAATASFENGLLRLSFPKAEEAKPQQIQIKPTTEGQAAAVSGEQTSARAVETVSSDDSLGASEKTEPSENAQPDANSGMDGSTEPNADGDMSDPAQNADSANEWKSTNSWQTGEQWQSADQSGEQSADSWQSNGQGQANEQPRIEQGS